MKNRELINKMTRAEIQTILENNGFAVYDNESMDDLREAVIVNIEDGTIKFEDLEPALNNIIDRETVRTTVNPRFNLN